MEQISYRRRNIGPLTRYGRFKSRNYTARRYTRGWRNPYPLYRSLPARKNTAPIGSYATNILTVKKMVQPDAFQWPPSGGGGASKFFAKSFILADLDDVGSYSAVYDSYRIIGVSIRITPRQNNTHIDEVPKAPMTGIFVVDYDDDTTPTTLASMRAYGTAKYLPLNQPFKFFVRPRTTGALWAGGAFSGYSVNRGGRTGPWIDMANTAVKYYGIKLASPVVSGSFPDNNFCVDINYTYYVQFRGQR